MARGVHSRRKCGQLFIGRLKTNCLVLEMSDAVARADEVKVNRVVRRRGLHTLELCMLNGTYSVLLAS